jgi:hypothetical protein
MSRTHTLALSILLAVSATDSIAQSPARRPAPSAPAKPATPQPQSSGAAPKSAGTTKPTQMPTAQAPSSPATVPPAAAKASDAAPVQATAVEPEATAPVSYPTLRSARRLNADSAATAKSFMLSVNPLGLLYGGLAGEAEKRLNAKNTVAAAINYWGAYGANYTSVDFKYRIYQNPTNEFRGLSYGPMVGFQRIGVVLCDVEFGEACSSTGLTLGGTVDYVLPFGEEERWAAAFGAGVKTSIGMKELSGVTFTYPFIRVGIGYSFPKK